MKAGQEEARLFSEMWEHIRERNDLLGWYLKKKKELGDLDEF